MIKLNFGLCLKCYCDDTVKSFVIDVIIFKRKLLKLVKMNVRLIFCMLDTGNPQICTLVFYRFYAENGEEDFVQLK